MTLDELLAELGDDKIRPAYLLAGEEPLLRDDALAALRVAVLAGAELEFNLDRLDARSISKGVLIDTLRTLPVMAPRRLVVLDEPDAKRGVPRDLLDALADLIGTLGDGDSVVLVVVSARPDRRSRWVKAFGAARVECDAPTRARDVAAFVRAEAGRQGLSLERGVAELLSERIGPQLMMLRQEIAKLGLSVDPGMPIGRATVAAGTLDVADEPIWDLTDAIGEGRCGDALVVLSHQLAAGAPPPVVLGALVSHFRRLLRTGHGGAVPGPPFVRKKLEGQARRFGVRRLRASLDAIHETDLAIKGAGALRPEMALERLVIALSG